MHFVITCWVIRLKSNIVLVLALFVFPSRRNLVKTILWCIVLVLDLSIYLFNHIYPRFFKEFSHFCTLNQSLGVRNPYMNLRGIHKFTFLASISVENLNVWSLLNNNQTSVFPQSLTTPIVFPTFLQQWASCCFFFNESSQIFSSPFLFPSTIIYTCFVPLATFELASSVLLSIWDSFLWKLPYECPMHVQ